MSAAAIDAAALLGGEHQQTVVGPDENAAVGEFEGDRPPLRADVGIDDGEVDADRHEGQRLGEHDRPRSRVMAADAVGEIDDPGGGTDRRDHAVADADEVVGEPVVRRGT